jgi:two-component system sensor histidine kinase UhpB
MSLAWRVVLLNSAVMLVAVLALALGPATVSTPVHARELVVLLVGVVAPTSCSCGTRSPRCGA